MKKDTYKIVGGNKLFGEVDVQTSKNGTLPLLSACLLTSQQVVINNFPQITDVFNMLKILKKLKIKTKVKGNSLLLNPINARNIKIGCKLAKTMRSSIFFLGAMLARFKQCTIAMPGGCNIGARPIDIHIKALKRLKVRVGRSGNYLKFDATNAVAGRIKLKLPSVGATENIIQFACLLPGITTIINAAKEPEVVELCNFLNQMGAKIEGAGTGVITICGVSFLNGIQYKPSADRIVAGTLMLATAMCGGEVIIKNSNPEENKNLINKLLSIGCKIEINCDIIKITSNRELKNLTSICTGYYPDFPTDLQSMMLTACCVGCGKTIITENLFENRFLTTTELIKMGANIHQVNKNEVEVIGGKLFGAEVYAKDLRGGAALVLASLVAEGTTKVNNVHFIDRGYQQLDFVLRSLGANIRRI